MSVNEDLEGNIVAAQEIEGQLAILGVSTVKFTTTEKEELPTAQLLLIALKTIRHLDYWTLMAPAIHIYLFDSAFLYHIDEPTNRLRVPAEIMDLMAYLVGFYARQGAKAILQFWSSFGLAATPKDRW